MERTKNSDKPLWIKTEGNYFRLANRKIIKKGQKFRANLEEIPEAFRDTIKLLGEDGNVKEEAPATEAPVTEAPVKLEYYLKKRDTGNWYDVFTKDGKKQNEKALTKDKAEALLADLNG